MLLAEPGSSEVLIQNMLNFILGISVCPKTGKFPFSHDFKV